MIGNIIENKDTMWASTLRPAFDLAIQIHNNNLSLVGCLRLLLQYQATSFGDILDRISQIGVEFHTYRCIILGNIEVQTTDHEAGIPDGSKYFSAVVHDMR